MAITSEEILETIRMVEMEGLDIRCATMAISLQDCCHSRPETLEKNIKTKISASAGRLVEVCKDLEKRYGIPIVNKRIAVTPVSVVAASCETGSYAGVATALDESAKQVNVDFVGGFSAFVQKGFTESDVKLINSIPEALSSTERVCSAVNVATTRNGINMDAINRMGDVIKETARLTSERDGVGCAKLSVFANIPGDVPFMPGAHHGFGQPEKVINIGISGPGVVRAVLEKMGEASLGDIAQGIKKTSFKIARMGELIGRELSERLDVQFGIVDLSLAPAPGAGDSVAKILELMGLEACGTHGSTAALALLTDSIKKGGAMASSYVGGFSGAFIPVSEDSGMTEAVEKKALSLDKLEAMTSVCAVGLDMVVIPGDTPVETISAIIADEVSIGVVNKKTTGVRIIPAPGRKAGEKVNFGGLLGEGIVMEVNRYSSRKFVRRGGVIPAPIHSLNN